MKRALRLTLSSLFLAVWLCSLPLYAQSPNVPHTRALPERPAGTVAHTFVVTDPGDVGDANPADTLCYPCTFRAAIENAQRSAGLDMIVFAKLVPVVSPLSELPVITTPVVIDGWLDSTHNVSLDGSQTSGAIGLRLAGGLSAVRNMEIHHFANGGVSLEGKDSSAVQGCFVHDNGMAGVLVSSKYHLVGASLLGYPNTIALNSGNGISLLEGSDYTAILWNRIGTADGSTAAANSGSGVSINSNGNLIYANQISGNGKHGVVSESTGQPPERNTISSNYIGTTSNGMAALPNSRSGITLPSDVGDTIAYNLISGNTAGGIVIGAWPSGTASSLWIAGNYIGTNIRGTASIPNAYGISGLGDGVLVSGNLISGNSAEGINMSGRLWQVRANRIGCDSAGAAALPNGRGGILVNAIQGISSDSIRIGGDAPADGNVISGNTLWGISVGASNVTISQNIIGLTASGSAALPNTGDGIVLSGPLDHTLIQYNLISGNGQDGIFGSDLSDNSIRANRIGTDRSGNNALGNNMHGVQLSKAPRTLIGGATTGEGNLISGNRQYGIFLTNTSSSLTAIQGNRIGTDSSGTRALVNALDGIVVQACKDILIGGATTTEGNVVVATEPAIHFVRTDSCWIASNIVGLSGGQSKHAITLAESNANVIGGSQGEGNLILGTTGFGVSLDHCSRNAIRGNSIGLTSQGLPDSRGIASGIVLTSSSNNIIGGTILAQGNIIGNCRSSGIFMWASDSNLVAMNAIGTNAAGTADLLNRLDGISLQRCNGNVIGGVGIGNRISHNMSAGISVISDNANMISENAIYDNGLGIDLVGAVGVAESNDTLDVDNGPNGLQNYPTITTATAGNQTRVKGVLNSAASQLYALQFFASPQCDTSGFGQGMRYLGSLSVATDDKGIASFTGTLAAPSSAGEAITATAIDSIGNTSEFSRCVTAAAPPRSIDLALELTTSRDWLVIGDTVTITHRVTNNGPIPATDVLLVDTLPSAFQYVSHTSSHGKTTVQGNTISTLIVNMDASSRESIAIVARAVKTGSVLFRGSVFAAENDSVPLNNSAEHGVVVLLDVDANHAPDASTLRLTGNYPNPATQSTCISFELQKAGRASLKVYNIYGALVATLADGDFEPGRHDLQWITGALPLGAYLAVLSAEGVVRTQRMILE